jgi:hypothetical protein
VTPDIIAKAHAILDGSARNDDARELARWVLERVDGVYGDVDRLVAGHGASPVVTPALLDFTEGCEACGYAQCLGVPTCRRCEPFLPEALR